MALGVYLHFFCFLLTVTSRIFVLYVNPLGFPVLIVKCMDFHDNLYCLSIFTCQTFHVILLHIGVPYHGSLMT